jgi:hypothetical protein
MGDPRECTPHLQLKRIPEHLDVIELDKMRNDANQDLAADEHIQGETQRAQCSAPVLAYAFGISHTVAPGMGQNWK